MTDAWTIYTDALAIYKATIGWLVPYQFWIGISAAIFSFVSTLVWIIASRVVTPKNLNAAIYVRNDRIEGDLAELVRGVYRQTERNALAAGFTAIAAILTGIYVLIGVRLGP
jgi:hypothetical protein